MTRVTGNSLGNPLGQPFYSFLKISRSGHFAKIIYQLCSTAASGFNPVFNPLGAGKKLMLTNKLNIIGNYSLKLMAK